MNALTIQRELNKLSPLYLEGMKDEYSFSHLQMDEFIQAFLCKLCRVHNTLDSKHDVVVTSKKRRRSISDIYRLCKYYYKNVTFKEVQYILARLSKKGVIGYFYCNGTESRVYMSRDYYKTHHFNPIHYPDPDEYGITPLDMEKLITEYS